MNYKLIKSSLALAIVLVLGVGATYAAFTSNTVTISGNTASTGNAAISLCNVPDGNNWKDVVAGFTVSSLTPGDEQALTGAESLLYVGNNDGELNNNLPSGRCTSYANPADDTKTSDVPMQLVPVITTLTTPDCTEALENDLQVKFIIGAVDSGYGTVSAWKGNAVAYGPVLSPDQAENVQIFMKLDNASTQQGKNCTFDIKFTGKEV